MVALRHGAPAMVETAGGAVRAGQVVLTHGAWAVGQPEFARAFAVGVDYMVVTEPIPELLAQIGWTSNVGLADHREMLYYLRRTEDDRIAMGGGGMALAFGGSIAGRVLASQRLADRRRGPRLALPAACRRALRACLERPHGHDQVGPAVLLHAAPGQRARRPGLLGPRPDLDQGRRQASWRRSCSAPTTSGSACRSSAAHAAAARAPALADGAHRRVGLRGERPRQPSAARRRRRWSARSCRSSSATHGERGGDNDRAPARAAGSRGGAMTLRRSRMRRSVCGSRSTTRSSRGRRPTPGRPAGQRPLRLSGARDDAGSAVLSISRVEVGYETSPQELAEQLVIHNRFAAHTAEQHGWTHPLALEGHHAGGYPAMHCDYVVPAADAGALPHGGPAPTAAGPARRHRRRPAQRRLCRRPSQRPLRCRPPAATSAPVRPLTAGLDRLRGPTHLPAHPQRRPARRPRRQPPCEDLVTRSFSSEPAGGSAVT